MAQGRAACQVDRVYPVKHKTRNMALDQKVDLCLLTLNIWETKEVQKEVSRLAIQT